MRGKCERCLNKWTMILNWHMITRIRDRLPSKVAFIVATDRPVWCARTMTDDHKRFPRS